jgi:hypothetical protein
MDAEGGIRRGYVWRLRFPMLGEKGRMEGAHIYTCWARIPLLGDEENGQGKGTGKSQFPELQ